MANQDKMFDSELRQLTLKLINDWFEIEVYCNRAQYCDGKKKRVVSVDIPEDKMRYADPLAEARETRPEFWNTTFKRKYEYFDPLQNRTVIKSEEVSILDVYGPGPSETRQVPTSVDLRLSNTRGMKPEAVVHRAAAAAERESLKLKTHQVARMQVGMKRLHQFAPVSAICIRLYAAGYSRAYMANSLDISKGQAIQIFECGLTWLMGVLHTNPVFREEFPDFRSAVKQHQAFRKLPKMRKSDLFGENDKHVKSPASAETTASCGV
ncbi:MAG: hypothetical protein NXH95_13615 [Pseudomonadaceae bacterium]|nr:hypothetical protein [Pseudomonadaceae bacterium]